MTLLDRVDWPSVLDGLCEALDPAQVVGHVARPPLRAEHAALAIAATHAGVTGTTAAVAAHSDLARPEPVGEWTYWTGRTVLPATLAHDSPERLSVPGRPPVHVDPRVGHLPHLAAVAACVVRAGHGLVVRHAPALVVGGRTTRDVEATFARGALGRVTHVELAPGSPDTVAWVWTHEAGHAADPRWSARTWVEREHYADAVGALLRGRPDVDLDGLDAVLDEAERATHAAVLDHTTAAAPELAADDEDSLPAPGVESFAAWLALDLGSR